MLSARTAIARSRRGITLGLAVHLLLWAAAAASLVVAALPLPGVLGMDGRLVMMVVLAVWLTASVRSWRSTRLGAEVRNLLASGEFAAAEEQIDRSLRSFSLFRPAKLVALHQLASLRLAQGRGGDAAALCREVLNHRLGLQPALRRSSQLMLAQALLDEGGPAASAAAAGPLAALRAERLSLAESTNLLHLDLDCRSRVGDWSGMLRDWMPKVQLAEVMPAGNSARVQALLALAALRLGRADVADWLRRRAELLVDSPEDLVRRRPLLAALWPPPAEPSIPAAQGSADAAPPAGDGDATDLQQL